MQGARRSRICPPRELAQGGFFSLLLAFTVSASAQPVALARTSEGAWWFLLHEQGCVSLHRATRAALSQGGLLVGPCDTAPLTSAGPVVAVAAFLDAFGILHLAWSDADKATYVRCESRHFATAEARRGLAREATPSMIAPGLVVRSLRIAPGIRPVVAGEREENIAVFCFDGHWRETFVGFSSRAPALSRGRGRDLYLAYRGPDGVRCARSSDGQHWSSPALVLPGTVQAGPSLAVGEGGPVIGAVVNGRALISSEKMDAWRHVALQPEIDPETGPPLLATDGYGTIWCVWSSGGWVRAARWLGEQFTPPLAIGRRPEALLVETAAPEHASNLAVLGITHKELHPTPVPVPHFTTADAHPVRFLDLRAMAAMEGVSTEGIRPTVTGVLPKPAPGELLPGTLITQDPKGSTLRAWFSRREGGEWVGYTACWSRRGWSVPEPLHLATPRPWLKPPSGALAVMADEEEPNPNRRYQMVAERVGATPAFLTSPDGHVWAYHAEVPSLQPLALLRDPLSPIERRWKIFTRIGTTGELNLMHSPDRQHWYPADPPCPGLEASDACFWVEEGRVLGLVNGGRTLLTGAQGDTLVPAADLPDLAGEKPGCLLGPPVVWEGRRCLFVAMPDAWRWAALPNHRWVALRATSTDLPGICTSVPIALTPGWRGGLLLDVQSASSGRGRGGVLVELLNGEGARITGWRAHLRGGDGWRKVSWARSGNMKELDTPTVRVRFTIAPGARLYGFRFTEGN